MQPPDGPIVSHILQSDNRGGEDAYMMGLIYAYLRQRDLLIDFLQGLKDMEEYDLTLKHYFEEI